MTADDIAIVELFALIERRYSLKYPRPVIALLRERHKTWDVFCCHDTGS
jgi:hypothetical protein